MDIAKLLHRDTCPTIQPLISDSSNIGNDATIKTSNTSTYKLNTPSHPSTIQIASSEGGHQTTIPTAPVSEGVPTSPPIDMDSVPVQKTTLQDPSVKHVPTYPTLYPQRPTPTPTITPRRSPRLKKQQFVSPTFPEKDFDSLLQSYKSVLKQQQPTKNTTYSYSPSHSPSSSPYYIPLPKSYKPKSSFKHPMRLLRRRILPTSFAQPTNFKSQAAQYLALKQFHIFSDSGKRLRIDDLLKKDPNTWPTSPSNELGRLTQGINNIKGNNAMIYIPHSEVPCNKKAAYAKMICNFKPN